MVRRGAEVRCASTLDGGEKSLAQPFLLLVIPQRSLGDFQVCHRGEYDATARAQDHRMDQCPSLCGAPKLGANTRERIVHRYTERRIGIVLGDATIQLGFLAVGQGKDVRGRVRLLGDAVPDVTDELKTLGDTQATIIEGWISHNMEAERRIPYRQVRAC